MGLFDTHRQRMYGYLACLTFAVADVVFIVKCCDLNLSRVFYLGTPLAVESAASFLGACYENTMDSLQKGSVSPLEEIATTHNDSYSIKKG